MPQTEIQLSGFTANIVEAERRGRLLVFLDNGRGLTSVLGLTRKEAQRFAKLLLGAALE